MKKRFSFLSFLFLMVGAATAQQETLLLRQPAISAKNIAFAYGGDLWVANRDGSNPRRLTVSPTGESAPWFSPDGNWITFTGTYDNNTDVYVISVNGGLPKRLTFHPGADQARGWSPDGKKVLFLSGMTSSTLRYPKLFTVSTEGELPQELPLPMTGNWASYSPDGKQLAYSTITDAFATWKRYRGGMTTPIRMVNLQSLESELIPHENASDVQPVWLGNKVYFLSDRNHTMNVFEYDGATKKVRQITSHKDYDVKNLSGNGSELIYEQAGKLHILNTQTGNGTDLKISIAPELLALRPAWKDVSNMIRSVQISPTGQRAVMEARGDIYSVPAKKGDWRNLTKSDGTHDRNPLWSPNGDKIAYASDASGEYQLMIVDQKGEKPAEAISLGDASFYTLEDWSPDGKKILYQDKKLSLWYMDLATKKPVKIATDTYGPNSTIRANWSPDNKWVVYSQSLDNNLGAIFLYELATAKSSQVTDNKSNAENPVFSRDGKYIYFTASTNTGLTAAWLDMSSYDRNITNSVYVVVLNAKDPSPFAPESDEKKGKEEPKKVEEAKEQEANKKSETSDKAKPEEKKDDAKPTDAVKVVIDLAGIGQRILAMPIPAANLGNLKTADGGKLFYVTYAQNGSPILNRFDLKERKSEVFMAGVGGYEISADGKKVLYLGGGSNIGIVDASGKPNVGDGKLNVSTLQAQIDPRNEWKEMIDDFWRIERDYFYVPNMHGANWNDVKKKYAVFIPHLSSRGDVNFLISEMMGEMVVGHN